MQLLTVKGERFDFVNSLNLRFKRALTTNNQTAKPRNKHASIVVYLEKLFLKGTIIVTCLLLVQLSPGRIDSDKCLVGDKTSSVSHITPTSKDTISLTKTSTIKELEDFIDNSFYNVSTIQSRDNTKNSTDVFSNSSLLQQRVEANPETIEARFFHVQAKDRIGNEKTRENHYLK